jgi:hypothetical protein
MPIGGFSFQPAGPQNGQGNSQQTAAISPQEAVRILSLRLPRNPQNSPIPSSLMAAAGGGGTSNLTALLRQLMAQFGQKEYVGPSGPGIDTGEIKSSPTGGQFPPFGGSGFAPPPPRIVPGGGEGRERVPEAPEPPQMQTGPLAPAVPHFNPKDLPMLDPNQFGGQPLF